MKIAVVSDDGLIICQHFGRAQYYAVATVEDNRIVSIEMREKMGHRILAKKILPHPAIRADTVLMRARSPATRGC